MAINFVDGKYVNPENGRVTLDPTMYKDWQIAEEAEKTLPSVDFFREKLGLLPEEIIPYGKTPKIDFIKVMERLKDKPDGKFIEVTAVTPTPFGEGKSTVSLGLIEGLGYIGKKYVGAVLLDNLLRADTVAERLTHLSLFHIKNHAVSKNRFVRRNAHCSNRGEQ